MTGTREITANERVNGHDWTGGAEACKNCGLTRSKWQETWWTCLEPAAATEADYPPGFDEGVARERERCLEIAAEELRNRPDGDGKIAAREIYRSIKDGVFAPPLPPDSEPAVSPRPDSAPPSAPPNSSGSSPGPAKPSDHPVAPLRQDSPTG